MPVFLSCKKGIFAGTRLCHGSCLHEPLIKYEFWQRDSLAVHLYNPDIAYQKLDYIHLNSLAEHWQLATDPSDYFFSTASFCEKNERRFSFLSDLRIEMIG